MSSSHVVTSMSVEQFNAYGKRMIESFTTNCTWPLTVYADHPVECAPATLRLTSDIGSYSALRRHWLRFYPQRPMWAEKPQNYIWDVQRFAVKPFVWYDAACRVDSGVLVWLDADTETKASIFWADFASLLGKADVAYLGRGSMHPETGCVIFRLPQAVPLLQWMREMLLNGGYRSLTDGWTDCHLLRAGLKALPTIKAKDLTSHLYDGEWRSGVDAMALSPLGPYITHYKGGKKKRDLVNA